MSDEGCLIWIDQKVIEHLFPQLLQQHSALYALGDVIIRDTNVAKVTNHCVLIFGPKHLNSFSKGNACFDWRSGLIESVSPKTEP